MAPMAKPGVEVLAGLTNDPVFGPLVAFGSGGALVELLDDVVFRVLPLTDRDVSEMIEETRVSRLLRGFRGSPPADIAALEQLLRSLGALAEAAHRGDRSQSGDRSSQRRRNFDRCACEIERLTAPSLAFGSIAGICKGIEKDIKIPEAGTNGRVPASN